MFKYILKLMFSKYDKWNLVFFRKDPNGFNTETISAGKDQRDELLQPPL